MALSFAVGTSALVNWGFSAGDIAVMAGAGRTVGTWLMAQSKDRGLADFLSVDTDKILTRRGLVDINALHKRWDCKLTLLQNGRPVSIVHPAGPRKPLVENLDRFTWIMILIVSALEASVSARDLRAVMSCFLTTLFEESPVGTDFLEHELSQHIQGWRSSACVRGVLQKARDAWDTLGQQQKHWPGYAPLSDRGEILRLLFWLINGLDTVFSTASTDVFCIAVVLQDLGIEITSATGKVVDPDESRLLLKRGGECEFHSILCVSVWPGDQGLNNMLRKIFEDGMEAVQADQAKAVLKHVGGWPMYLFSTGYERSARKRQTTCETRLAGSFLPKHTYAAAHGLGNLVNAMEPDDRSSLESYLKRLSESELINLESHISDLALAQLQTYLMGFYYRLFLPLLDISRLVRAEAFGSWGFSDAHFLRQVISLLADDFQKDEWTKISRASLLSFMAYMFAGAQVGMIDGASSSLAIGVVAKLTLLTQATLGAVPSFEEMGKFFLLDIDTSVIPCNAKGIVTEGTPPPLDVVSVDRNGKEVDKFLDSDLKDNGTDFTSHIVPDWDHDVQACMVAFRHEGRLVQSLPPSLIEHALERVFKDGFHFRSSGEDSSGDTDGEEVKSIDLMTVVSISRYHGGKTFRAGQGDAALLIPSLGMPKARACILGMYQNFTDGPSKTEEYSFVLVRNFQDVVKALKGGRRYLVATEEPPRRFVRSSIFKTEDLSKMINGSDGELTNEEWKLLRTWKDSFP